MFNIENKFLLNSIVENKTDNNSDDLILTGIASTTKEPSLYGEIMTEDALNQMCEQAVNLPILEGHEGKSLDTVIGVITNAYVEDGDLHIDFRVVPKHRERIQEFLDTGVPIGLSIGAQALIDNETQQVTGVTLIEVSLTPVPANRVAHNTVTVKEGYYTGNCLSGICYQIIKDNVIMEDNNMADEEKKANPEEVKEEEPLTIDKVKEMLDERFAEEKEALVATVVEEVKTELKKEAEASEEKVEEAVEEKPKEDEEKPEEGDSEEQGASEDEDEEDKEVKLSAPVIDEDKIIESITERILKESKEDKEVKSSAPVIDEDKLVESLTEKILNSLGEKRDVSGTKTETALQESADTQEEDKPFTSEEAAKLIINDLNRKDPLTRAVNEARGL